MRKKILSLLLIISMLVSLLPSTAMAAATEDSSSTVTAQILEQKNPFQDVTESDWYYEAVKFAMQNGIFNGTGANTFSPGGTMTRAMYVTVMGRIAGINPADYSGSSGFNDVSADTYYASYVVWAAQKGIIKGITETSFSPSALVTREQMAVMTVRFFDAYGIAYPAATVTNRPVDFDLIAGWAREPVMKLWACGLFHGDSFGNFNPIANATRAEGAVFCMRTVETVGNWLAQPDIKPEQPETQQPTGGNSSGGSSNRVVSFNTNGGLAIDSMYVKAGGT
ncbi:MAG: hypothetical protein H6Q64_2478, partial [Firmicutes bacterium]|nr:hypothetical protein [Bacillota bacterium]